MCFWSKNDKELGRADLALETGALLAWRDPRPSCPTHQTRCPLNPGFLPRSWNPGGLPQCLFLDVFSKPLFRPGAPGAVQRVPAGLGGPYCTGSFPGHYPRGPGPHIGPTHAFSPPGGPRGSQTPRSPRGVKIRDFPQRRVLRIGTSRGHGWNPRGRDCVFWWFLAPCRNLVGRVRTHDPKFFLFSLSFVP